MTAARIPDSGSVLVSLKDISNHKEAQEELIRIVTQFRQLMVEMAKGVKKLGG